MAKTYIEWCRLFNRLSERMWESTTPQRYNYWQHHYRKLSALLKQKGWNL